MLCDQPCTRLPPVLVAAAYSRSVPTAVDGWTPNSRINNGVISEPPPTPVIPTSRPTPKPEATYRGSITDTDRTSACRPSQRFLQLFPLGWKQLSRRFDHVRRMNLPVTTIGRPGKRMFLASVAVR